MLGFMLGVLWAALPAGQEAGGRVPESAEAVCPLLPGLKIPDSIVQDVDGRPVSLRDLVAQRPTVLVFFRGGW